jgi:hypothetical protein
MTMTELKLASSGVKLPDEQSRRDILIASLRTARTRVQLLMTEMDEVGTALKCNLLSPESAVGWLRDIDALYFLNPDIWREDHPTSVAREAVAA